jgi:hypothetical protein
MIRKGTIFFLFLWGLLGARTPICVGFVCCFCLDFGPFFSFYSCSLAGCCLFIYLFGFRAFIPLTYVRIPICFWSQ